MNDKPMLCRAGIHAWVPAVPKRALPPGASVPERCARCGDPREG